jgi:hypothetical protein
VTGLSLQSDGAIVWTSLHFSIMVVVVAAAVATVVVVAARLWR